MVSIKAGLHIQCSMITITCLRVIFGWKPAVTLAPCKGIQIPESGKSFLVKSGILEVESGIQLKESGIPLTIGTQIPLMKNPESNL